MWTVYIIEAENGKYYTGITTDIQNRFRKHLAGKGAKFFRTSKPKQILYQKQCLDKSEALKLEASIKKLSKVEKKKLVRGGD